LTINVESFEQDGGGKVLLSGLRENVSRCRSSRFMRVKDASVTSHGEDPGMDRGNGARSTETVGRWQRYERKAMPRGEEMKGSYR
jgi:hypothetical protein